MSFDPSFSAEYNVYEDLYLETSLSNRSTCRGCSKRIDKDILRWCSVEVQDYDEGYQTKRYYHTGCLLPSAGHPLVDYSKKRQTGTLREMSTMPSTKVEKELFQSVVDKYVAYRIKYDGQFEKKKDKKEKETKKKQQDSESEEETSNTKRKSTKSDDPLGGYDKAAKKIYEEKLKSLSTKTIAQLKAICKANNQIQSGNKDVILSRVADGFALGAIPQCTKCGGGKLRFTQSTGDYFCPGYMEDTDKIDCDATFKFEEVVRFDWVDA